MHEQQSSVDGDGDNAIRDSVSGQSSRFRAISIVPPDEEEEAMPAVIVRAPSFPQAATRKIVDEKQDFEFFAIIAEAQPRKGADTVGFITADANGYHVSFKPAGKQPANVPRRVSYLANERQIQAAAGLNMKEAVYIVAVGQEKFGGIKLVSETSEDDKIKLYVAAQTHHLRVLCKKLELETISAEERRQLAAYVQNPASIPSVKFQVGKAEYIPPMQIAYTGNNGEVSHVAMAQFLSDYKHDLARNAARLLRQEAAAQQQASAQFAPIPPAGAAHDGRFLQETEMQRETVTLTVGAARAYLSSQIESGQTGQIHLRNTQETPETSGRIAAFISQLCEDLGDIGGRGVSHICFRETQPGNIAAQVASIAASVAVVKRALDGGENPEAAKGRALNMAHDYSTPLPSLAAQVNAFVPVEAPAVVHVARGRERLGAAKSKTGYRGELTQEQRRKELKDRVREAIQTASVPPSEFTPAAPTRQDGSGATNTQRPPSPAP